MIRSIALLLAVLAPAASGAAVTPELEIHDFTYAPATVTITPGTTVRWVNHDEETHTVTSTSGLFASPGLDMDETFAHTFTRPGTYTYYCALHPRMRATVVVKGD